LDFEIIYPRIRDVLPSIKEYSLTMIGEPLLIKNFNDIVFKMSEFGARLNLVTNGTLISQSNIDTIVRYSSNIGLSIDGATKVTFERLRYGANFDRWIQNVKNLVSAIESAERKPTVAFCSTIMGSNLNEMPDIVQLAGDLGVRYVQFFPVGLNEKQTHLVGEPIGYHHNLLIQKLGESQNIAARLGIQLIHPDFERAKPKGSNESERLTEAKSFYCSLLYERAYISSEGEVNPCCIPGPPPMGNIFYHNLIEIWDGDNYRQFRQQFQSQSPPEWCKNCLLRVTGNGK
jgi:radical SAM protein with 4Fe4S-binding SPASM domain